MNLAWIQSTGCCGQFLYHILGLYYISNDVLFLSHSNPDYVKYKKSTPPLLFGIPPLYYVTPYVLKLLFCCEFPFYSVKPEPEDIEGKKTTGEETDKLKDADVVEKQPL